MLDPIQHPKIPRRNSITLPILRAKVFGIEHPRFKRHCRIATRARLGVMFRREALRVFRDPDKGGTEQPRYHSETLCAKPLLTQSGL
jgi:hypothetical protein